MKYEFFPQEQQNWCVPACLQSVLLRHNTFLSQEDIFSQLDRIGDGVFLSREGLNRFLSGYGMSSDYIHHQESFPEIDFVLDEALKKEKDILAAFKCQGPRLGHVSLVLNLPYPNITLHDPELGIRTLELSELLSSMSPNGQSGFYFIS